MKPRVDNSKPDFIVWMNVSTSAEWNRPPVGIVRVEQSLAAALEELLGGQRLKKCIWQDGRFVEYIPARKVDLKVEAAIDVILPRTPTFDPSRQFLRRALERHSTQTGTLAERSGHHFDVSIPLHDAEPLEPRPGDVLISVGLDWDKPYSNEFFNLKKKRGLHIITCCYDLIPVLFPHYCVGDVAPRFREYFSTLTWGSSGVLCISEQTKKDYVSLCHSSGSPAIPTCVMPLGDSVPNIDGGISEEIEKLSGQPFLLFVSTIERRKNHEVLYKAYRILCETGHKDALPKLVFVGMPGWGVGDLLKDISLDPLTQGLIVQLNHVTDNELNWLYEHAFFCVYPSLYEGWGLPVAEALVHGKAILSSDKGSLIEVGGDLVTYVAPWDPYSWADKILEFCRDPERVSKIEARVRAEYKGRTWRDAARVVNAFVDSVVADQPRFPLVLAPGYDCSTQAGVHVGGNLRSTDLSGYLMFGPYWALGRGAYRIQVFGRLLGKESVDITLDFLSDQNKRTYYEQQLTIKSESISGSPKGSAPAVFLVAEFEVMLDSQLDDFQVRCFIRGGSIELTRVCIMQG
jgi:glycosyltransferase involved in cell wall biosynthesis